jgi:hypothetical protein
MHVAAFVRLNNLFQSVKQIARLLARLDLSQIFLHFIKKLTRKQQKRQTKNIINGKRA